MMNEPPPFPGRRLAGISLARRLRLRCGPAAGPLLRALSRWRPEPCPPVAARAALSCLTLDLVAEPERALAVMALALLAETGELTRAGLAELRAILGPQLGHALFRLIALATGSARPLSAPEARSCLRLLAPLRGRLSDPGRDRRLRRVLALGELLAPGRENGTGYFGRRGGRLLISREGERSLDRLVRLGAGAGPETADEPAEPGYLAPADGTAWLGLSPAEETLALALLERDPEQVRAVPLARPRTDSAPDPEFRLGSRTLTLPATWPAPLLAAIRRALDQIARRLVRTPEELAFWLLGTDGPSGVFVPLALLDLPSEPVLAVLARDPLPWVIPEALRARPDRAFLWSRPDPVSGRELVGPVLPVSGDGAAEGGPARVELTISRAAALDRARRAPARNDRRLPPSLTRAAFTGPALDCLRRALGPRAEALSGLTLWELARLARPTEPPADAAQEHPEEERP